MSEHTGRVNVIRPFRGQARTVSGGGKQVCVWDQQSGELAWKVDADRYEVDAVLPHSSGCVVSAGTFGTVSVLEGDTGAVRHTFELGQAAGELFELPDGRVAVGDEEYEDLKLLDVVTGAVADLEPQGEQGGVRWVRVKGSTLEALGNGAGLCRYDLATAGFLSRVFGPDGETCGLVGDDRAMSFEGDVLSIWSTTDGGVLHRVDGLADLRHATVSPDGSLIAAGTKAGVTLIDVARGERTRELTYGPWPRLACFSEDASQVVVVIDAKPRSSLKVFETATGKDLGGWDGERVSTITLMPGWLLLGKESGAIERLAM